MDREQATKGPFQQEYAHFISNVVVVSGGLGPLLGWRGG